MNPRVFLRRTAALALIVLMQLHGKIEACVAQEPRQEVLQIMAQSQQALDLHDEVKALALIREGLVLFPDYEDLKIQLARVYVQQKHDRQAMGLLNAILLANPSSRNAKLELAQIFGYRENYRESDRLYRELLAANADDEAASLGLVHNLLLEGKRQSSRSRNCSRRLLDTPPAWSFSNTVIIWRRSPPAKPRLEPRPSRAKH